MEDVRTGAWDEDGAARVRIKVRNGGGAYAVASGVLSFERQAPAAAGQRRQSIR